MKIYQKIYTLIYLALGKWHYAMCLFCEIKNIEIYSTVQKYGIDLIWYRNISRSEKYNNIPYENYEHIKCLVMFY